MLSNRAPAKSAVVPGGGCGYGHAPICSVGTCRAVASGTVGNRRESAACGIYISRECGHRAEAYEQNAVGRTSFFFIWRCWGQVLEVGGVQQATKPGRDSSWIREEFFWFVTRGRALVGTNQATSSDARRAAIHTHPSTAAQPLHNSPDTALQHSAVARSRPETQSTRSGTLRRNLRVTSWARAAATTPGAGEWLSMLRVPHSA